MKVILLPSLRVALLTVALLIPSPYATARERAAVVFQSDFGVKDGAVSAMKGVAFAVDPALPLFDLTHEIPPFNVWEAAFRLHQTARYWPSNTVFVSVCDPGVGTARRSVVLRTLTGHRFVTPDNGTLTLVAESMGVAELRVIDAAKQRLKGSEDSYTFHGRDLFAYVAARLAAGKLRLSEVGELATNGVVTLPYQRAEFRDGTLRGTIPVLDPNYGNVWSNIGKAVYAPFALKVGERYQVRLLEKERVVWSGSVPFVESFGGVPEGEPLLYVNSLLELAIALNQGDFARTHGIRSGPDWIFEVRRE